MDFKLGYYNALLKLIDRFFDDELDQHVFEECARYIFGTKAYIMFTIDKLMLSIMRQVRLSTCLFPASCTELLKHSFSIAPSNCHRSQGTRITLILQKES